MGFRNASPAEPKDKAKRSLLFTERQQWPDLGRSMVDDLEQFVTDQDCAVHSQWRGSPYLHERPVRASEVLQHEVFRTLQNASM